MSNEDNNFEVKCKVKQEEMGYYYRNFKKKGFLILSSHRICYIL